MVLHKGALEAQLRDENKLIKSGVLRDENPLDTSDGFRDLLQACRRGDLKTSQELISAGVNINGKDRFDYTPLIVASLCGHFELVRLLLESGALAERNTFQGERCIYNALNDRIRNLLLEYDYSKSTDPLQPWASHITSLLTRDNPKTSDITLNAAKDSFHLHKFILWSRSPYFRRKLSEAANTTSWNLPATIPADAFRLVLQYLYLGDIPKDLVDPRSMATEEEVLTSADKISKQLEIDKLWEAILVTDRRLARQRYQDEVERAQRQIASFLRENILPHRMEIDTDRVGEVKWPHDNAIFADCLLRADMPVDEEEEGEGDKAGDEARNGHDTPEQRQQQRPNGIPVGPVADSAGGASGSGGPRKPRRSVLYPAHKAMLLRSPYFETMFSSEFKEAHAGEHLHVITIDCIPEVLQVLLTFLYTEKADFPLDIALDVLYTADMLFLDKLKTKAAQAISTLGSGNSNALVDRTHGAAAAAAAAAASTQQGSKNGNVAGVDAVEPDDPDMEPINIYDVIRAAWDLRVQRLEEFAARYLAYRLEDYIDEEDFAELIRESAQRLKTREETDTIELLDDIRYYLSERFRLRFEDAGIDDMIDAQGEINAETVEGLADASAVAAAAAAATAASHEDRDGTKDASHPEETNSSQKGNAAAGQSTVPSEETGGEEEGGLQTLGGDAAEDEFESDAINYQILLGKIDTMLDRLELDA